MPNNMFDHNVLKYILLLIMEKEWKIFASESCPNCGDSLEVLSGCPEENDTDFEQWFTDGEEVRCCSECGFVSAISADEEGVWVQDGNITELQDEVE